MAKRCSLVAKFTATHGRNLGIDIEWPPRKCLPAPMLDRFLPLLPIGAPNIVNRSGVPVLPHSFPTLRRSKNENPRPTVLALAFVGPDPANLISDGAKRVRKQLAASHLSRACFANADDIEDTRLEDL